MLLLMVFLNGLWTLESGLPLDISVSSASLNAPGNINRPNVNATPQIFGLVGPGRKYFAVSTADAVANPLIEVVEVASMRTVGKLPVPSSTDDLAPCTTSPVRAAAWAAHSTAHPASLGAVRQWEITDLDCDR